MVRCPTRSDSSAIEAGECGYHEDVSDGEDMLVMVWRVSGGVDVLLLVWARQWCCGRASDGINISAVVWLCNYWWWWRVLVHVRLHDHYKARRRSFISLSISGLAHITSSHAGLKLPGLPSPHVRLAIAWASWNTLTIGDGGVWGHDIPLQWEIEAFATSKPPFTGYWKHLWKSFWI